MSDDPFKMFETPEDDHGNDDKAPGKTVQVSQEQWDTMVANQEAERKRNNELWQMMLQGKQAPAGNQTQTQTEPQFKLVLDGLPDPRDDADGYHKGLAERLGQTLTDMQRSVNEQHQRQLMQSQTQTQTVEKAWAMIQKENPELAEFPQVAEMAANAYWADLRSKGIDPITAVQTDMATVVHQVGEAGMNMLRSIRGEAVDDVSSGRTRMLSGSGPKPKGKAKADTPDENSFVKDIMRLQKEQRIY